MRSITKLWSANIDSTLKYYTGLSFQILILVLLLSGGVFAQRSPAASLPASLRISRHHPDLALSSLKQLYGKAITANNQRLAGECLQQMGQICFNQGHYAKALELHLQAEKVFDATGSKNFTAGNLNQMGTLYYYLKQQDKSREAYFKALQLYRNAGNVNGEADVLGNIGHLFEKQQQYDSAFRYQHMALAGYQRVHAKPGEAKIYENLGSIYEDLAKYDSAYLFFNQSRKLYAASRDTIANIEVINNIGDVLRKTGRYAQSIQQSRIAYNLALQTQNLYQQASSSRDLGKSYQLMHQMDSAYHYLELSRRYSLDIYSKEALNQSAFLQVLYDIDKKSSEIARLNAVRKTNMVITIAVVTGIVLLIIIGIVTFSRQRLKLRDQRILAAQDKSIYEAQREVMQLELRNRVLEEETLKQQLELKGRELSTHTLNLIKNNQLLEQMRTTLQQMVKDEKRDQKKQMQQIVQQINQSFNHEQNWKEFTNAFEQVHQSFFDKLKLHSTDLTSADIRLIALLKVNMDSKDIANLLGISIDSLRVARHRLRKKIQLGQGDNLSSFIQSL